MPKVVPRSGTGDPGASAAAEPMVEIILHVEGTNIPITLSLSECTRTTWGEFCKIIVEKYLPKVHPTLILKILTKISPNKRLSHYKARVGDGYAIIIQVNWSPADIPGFARLPFEPSYTEVNMALVPTEGGALQLMTKPHLPLLQPAEGEPLPTSLDVNLVITAVSSASPPLPSNVARTSVVTLNEHKSFPGCVDKFSVETANGENDILPDQSSYAASATAAAVAAVDTGKKRKGSPKGQTASTKKKAKSAKKKDEEEGTSKSDDDNDGAKKPAAKKGGAAAAAAKKSAPKKDAAAAGKKSPPEESAVAEESKTPSKKAGMDMIRKYEAAKAKQLNESSSKTDSPSIPKVISSKKTTKITPKKGKATATAAKDDTDAKKPSATEEAGRDRAPSVDKGNEMLRVYEEAKAKENSTGKEKKTPSKKSKDSGDSTKSSSSSKKTKGSSKKEKAKGDEEKIAKKPSAAAAAAKEESGEEKNEDSTKPSSGKKAKGSSKKKDEAKADKGESSAKKSSAPEEDGKSAKKKAKTAAASEATKVSKKKRKASSSEDKTADAPNSPSKKKAKSSKGDEKSTPAKDDGKKSAAAAAATKKAESEKKTRGPKRKDYDDIPSEPAVGFPEGWTSKNIPRSVGDKYDQRWYSPGGMTFNTKKGATMFKKFVNEGNDEATAYKLFKKAEKEAKEERKAEREAKAMKKKKMEVVESEVV